MWELENQSGAMFLCDRDIWTIYATLPSVAGTLLLHFLSCVGEAHKVLNKETYMLFNQSLYLSLLLKFKPHLNDRWPVIQTTKPLSFLLFIAYTLLEISHENLEQEPKEKQKHLLFSILSTLKTIIF